jgi:hypothetical protein
MELNSFRELLLKKSVDNPTLHTLICMMKDEIIADKIIEHLEKMARPGAGMGAKANAGVTAFASQLKNKDVEMMRDALAHHVAHHKAALKRGDRKAADEHLNKIVPLMHLAGKASPHSNQQLGLDYIPMESWETNYTSPERNTETTGKLKEGTKGLRRRLSNTPRSKNSRSVPDYRYLEMPPHGEHPDSETSPHKGGYPFEETQIGNPGKIDTKEAFLAHPEVAEDTQGFTSHPFDFHPVHRIQDMTQDEFANQAEDFADKMHNWHDSEHSKKWTDKVKGDYTKDPEGFKTRGKVKPKHHFEGMELEKMPHHTGAVPKEDVSNLPAALQAKFGNRQASPPTTEAPEAVPKPAYDVSKLPAALQAKFGKK